VYFSILLLYSDVRGSNYEDDFDFSWKKTKTSIYSQNDMLDIVRLYSAFSCFGWFVSSELTGYLILIITIYIEKYICYAVAISIMTGLPSKCFNKHNVMFKGDMSNTFIQYLVNITNIYIFL